MNATRARPIITCLPLRQKELHTFIGGCKPHWLSGDP